MEAAESPYVDREYLGDETNLIHMMEEAALNARTTERTESERDWRMNLMWLDSQPWFKRNTTGDVQWIAPERRSNRKFMNIIFPRVMVLAGNETYIPRFEGRTSAAADLENVMRARAVADAANHSVHAARLPMAQRVAHIYKHTFGHCWYKVGFDPGRGPMGPTYGQVPCPDCQGVGAVLGMDGQPYPCTKCSTQGVLLGQPDLPPPDPGNVYDVTGEQPQGELQVDLVPPWEILCDPDAPDLFTTQWVMHERDMDREAAWFMFCQGTGINAADLETSSFVTQMERLFSTAMNSARRGSSRKNQVRVREYFRLRTEKHQNGLYGCAIGGKLIRGGKLPYTHNQIPYVPLRCHIIPGKLYPRGTVDNLLPIAVAVDDLLTLLYTRAQMTAQARILAPRGSGVDLTDVQGVMEYDWKNGRGKPEWFNDSGASPDAVQMIDRLLKQADDVSFANDVMRGESSGSDDNARYSAFREQRAINPIKPMIDDNAESHERVGRLLVDTMKIFYRDGRIMRQFGPHGRAKFGTFMLEQIGDSSDAHLIQVRDVGRTLASRRQDLYEAIKAGVFADPKLMKLAEFSDPAQMYDEREVHESEALMENERIRSGNLTPQMRQQSAPPPQPGMPPMPPPPPIQYVGIEAPQRYQDHQIHADAHGPLLAELRMRYGAQHPMVNAMMQHMAEHEELAAWEQMNRANQQQQAAAGLGLANAANPQFQPPESTESAQNAGVPMDQSQTLPQGLPSPPETQPALQQVDNQLRGTGVVNGPPIG